MAEAMDRTNGSANKLKTIKQPKIMKNQETIRALDQLQASDLNNKEEALLQASDLNNKAEDLYNKEKYQESLELHLKALNIRELYAPNSIDLANSYNNIGIVPMMV